jgi:putative ABC transport system substrate-binding protein
MMDRRKLIGAMAAFSATLAARAQVPGRVYRIGYLSPGSATQDGISSAFRDALLKMGYAEGRNLVIESRFADAHFDRLPALAKDLVQAGVDIIVTIGTPTVQAAKEATTTIPIVMAGSADPVEHKLVTSLARPGGNVTGVTHSPGPQISGKGLQLLKEAVPALSRAAILWDSSAVHEGLSLDAQREVAQAIGIKLLPLDVKTLDELTAAFATAIREHVDSLFVFPNFINNKHLMLILDFAATHRLPTMFQDDRSVAAGGLMSYYELGRSASARSGLRGQDSQGRQAGGLAGGTADEVRVDHQPQNGKSAEHDNPGGAACSCRQGDRVKWRHSGVRQSPTRTGHDQVTT